MTAESLFAHKLRNDLQTAALTALLALLCAYLAWFVGGPVLAWGAIAAVAALYFANPAASPRLVMSLYQGRAISSRQSRRGWTGYSPSCRGAPGSTARRGSTTYRRGS